MEVYKAGQGSFARLCVWVFAIIVDVLGCVELYSYIQRRDDGPLIPLAVFEKLPLFGVPLSWKFLLCVVLFVGILWLLKLYMGRHSTVDALIETEQEMKKVSWPTKDESFNATWVVVFVTVIMTATLFVFDFVLGSFLRLIF